MHSKATPTSPFSASFVILRNRDGSAIDDPLPRKNLRVVNFLKGFLVMMLMTIVAATNVHAQTYYQRVYANSQDVDKTPLLCTVCSVGNAANAVDGNVNTFATVNNTVGLVGGAVWLDLIFPAPIPVTQGVILKVGTGALVSVTLGNITAQPMSGTATSKGDATSLNTALAKLLVSDNKAEVYLPAPSASGATGTYDRVRIRIGALASVATSIEIYEAYYNVPASGTLACDKPIDVIGGVQSLIDIAGLVNLGTVTNSQNAIDNSLSTAATMETLANVAAYTRLNVIFPGLAKTGDSVRITLGTTGGLLSATALQSLTFLTFNGNTVVDSINGSSSLLTLSLLNGPGTPQVATFASSGPFDHVEIRLGGLANVLNSLYVYDVGRVIPSPFVTAASANQTTCLNSAATFNISNPDATLNYTWYNSGGTIVQGPATTSSYSPPVNTAGTFTYYVAANRTMCTTGSQRVPLTLKVNPYTTAADLNFSDSAYSCSGDTVRIIPTSTFLTAKPVYSWWKDAAKTTPITNGLVEGSIKYFVDSTGRLTIVGLTAATADYYVSAADSNHCDNRANELKKVTVVQTGKAPTPTLGSSTVYASVGQPVVLRATPPGGGTIFWYSDTTQAPIGTGDTLLVGPFPAAGTHIYYAAARLSASGACESYRVADTAVIIPLVTNTSCNAPTTTTTGTTLGCVLCSVTNPNGAVDTTANNYSTLSIPVGLLGGSVYQQLFFPSPGAASDSLRITFGYPGGLADVSLLGGVEITVANGTTVIRRDTLANLLRAQLLSGAGPYTVTIPAGGVYNTVQVKLTGVANLLTSLRLYGVRAVAPNPTFTINTNGTACVNETATITANGLGANSIRWYADSTTATVAGSNPTFTTPQLTTPGVVTYYAQVVAANGCANPERIPVRITVNPLGTAADININDTTIACTSNSAVLTPTVNSASGITNPVIKWYFDQAKTQPVTNGTTAGITYAVDTTGKLTITGLAAGTYTYYAAISGSNRCENAPNTLKPAIVNVVAAPAGPIVPGTVVTTTGQTATLTATPVAGATITWYADSTTTTALGTGTPFNVGPFTNPGTYTYFAAMSIPGACESVRVRVTVVVTGPVVPSPDCNVPTSQVSGTSLGCILCSVQDPNNSIDSINTNYTRLSMPVGLLGGSVYQQLIFANPGNTGDSVRITFGAPGGLADVSLLGGVVVRLYNNTTLVKADTIANLLTLRLLSGQQFTATLPATGTYDRVEVRLTGIANLLHSIDIYGARILYPRPVINTPNDTACVNTKATLSVTPAAGTGVRWYADSTSTTVLASTSTFTTDTLRTPGTVKYWVAVYGGPANCENPERYPVTVTVTPPPAVPGTDQTVSVCSGSNVVLQINNPAQGLTYNWFNAAQGGTKLNTDSGFTFPVNGVTRDTTLYVEAQSACGAVSTTRQAFHITVSSGLQAPVVSPNPAIVRLNESAVLTATLPVANATIAWFRDATTTDTLFIGTSFGAPSKPTPDTTIYYAQAFIAGGGTCQSVRVPVTVITQVGDSLEVPCERATSQTIGGSGLLVLGNVYNPSFAVDNNQNTGSSLVINLGALNATVWQRAAFNGLSAPGDSVRVRLSSPNQILSAAVLASVQLTAYNGNTPVDSVVLSNPLLHVDLLSGGRTGEYTFLPNGLYDAIEVKLKSGIVGALTDINFNSARRIIAAPKVQASTVTVCSGSTATLNVENPSANVTYRWYSSNGVYLAGKDGASFTTGAITSDTSFLVEAYRAGADCPSSAKTPVTVKVIETPLAPVVTPDSVAVCPGSNASASISNPVRGYTYGWYNVATGGTKLNTDSGFVFTVNNVTAPVTYYVEAKNDSCGIVSATRTAVLFTTASQLGVPVITPSRAVVDTGESAILVATPPAANANVYWFGSQFGSDTLYKGLQYISQPRSVAATDTVWVEAVLGDNSSCKSARVAALIVTTPLPPNAVPCERAVAQTNSNTTIGGGILVLGSVVNPDRAVDNNTVSSSSLVLNLGALNAAVWQRAAFNGLSTLGDTVEVMLSSPGQVLSAALLASVQLTTYNGNTPGDSLLTNNPLLHMKLLTGTEGVILSFVPTKQFDAIEVKLKSGVLAALTAVDFNYARRGIVAPTVSASDSSVCVGTPVTLKVNNPVAGVTYTWYNQDGTKLADSTAYVVPATNPAGIYNFTVTATRDNCNIQTSAVARVSIQGIPGAPVADSSNPATVCVSNLPATLKVIPQPGVTYTWYDAAGNQLTANNNAYTTPATMAVGTYSYFVKANNGNGCANDTARTQITLSVFNNATAADIRIDSVQSICLGDTARLVPTSSVANAVFKWYTSQQKTTPITTGVDAAGVLTLPNLTAGTYNYYVSVSANGQCENAAGNLKQVTVNVGTPADSTDIQVSGASTCVNTTVSLTAGSTTVTNPVFRWYRDAALTQFIRSGAVFTTDTLRTTTTYYVTVQGTNKCENAPGKAKAVTVSVSSFTTPTVQGAAICAGQTATVRVLNPDPAVTYRWYNNSSKGQLLATADTFRTGVLNADTTFYLEATSGQCALALIPAVVTVNGAPRPVVDSVQTACGGTRATLTIKAPASGVTYRWYNVPVGGTALNSDAGTTFVTDTLRASTIYYVEAVGQAGCVGTSTRVPVTVAIAPTPAAPVLVTNNQTVCAGGNVTFIINNPDASVTYRWFDAPVNGTELTPATPTSFTATGVTATTTYYVAAFNSAGCSNAGGRTSATVTVLPAPATPTVAVADQAACLDNAITFQISNPDPQLRYVWYNSLTNDSLATGASFNTGKLRASADYYVVAKNLAGCSSLSRTTVHATIVDSLATPSVAPNAKVCLGQTLSLAVINPVNGVVYHWYNSATSTTPVATGATVNINGVTTNTSYFVDASLAAGNCVSSSRGRVDVTVSSVPAAPAVANPAVTTCMNSLAVLKVQNPDRSLTYRWYTTAQGGTPVTTGDSVTVGPVTANGTYYVEAVNANGCSSATRTLVNVSVGNAPGAPQVAGNDISKCPGETYVLTASSTTPGATFAWYSTQNGTTPVATGAQFTTPPISQDVVYYVEASIGSNCASATRTAVPVTVLKPLAAPAVTVSNRTATSVTFTWAAVPGADRYVVSVNDSTNFVAPSSGANGTSHTVSNLQPNQNVTLYVRAIGAGVCQNSLLASVTDKTTNPQGNNIFVPNLFSPNGDGVNDIEYVYGTAIAQLEFRIYNQWGQLVFTSKDQRQGWDGTMSGQKQPVGVYVYIVKATMQDGTVITKKGNVTLMR